MSFDNANASSAATRCVGASPRNSLVSLGKSGSSFISAYDALIRACAEERTRSLAAGLAGVERRSGAGVGAVDKAGASAANEASYAVTAGFVGEHSDRPGLDHFRPDPAPVAGPGQLAVDNASRYSFKRDAAGNREAALLP